MTRYALLLRGINVGGRVVRMADLKVCLEAAGLRQVVTLLQSGNVAFESDLGGPELKKGIETALTERFDYPAKVQVLPMARLAKIIADYPFGTTSESQHDYVLFLENDLAKDLINEPCEMAPGEKVAAGDGVVYWRVDKGSTLKSNFAKLLTKSKYKAFNTNRNIRTLRKLTAL